MVERKYSYITEITLGHNQHKNGYTFWNIISKETLYWRAECRIIHYADAAYPLSKNTIVNFAYN